MALAVSAKDEVGESQPIESDFRKQIPAEGLREYWYPAVLAKKLGRRRPVGVRLLGENLVFFRDRAGKIVALQDLCAHRGSKLSRGVCHFPGTITCPYHGWTYDAEGKCVAALVEGPESRIPQSGVEVPVKQVKELCGIAWVWMGDGDPVPLEEDVPEEFLDPNVHVLTEVQLWPINWRPLIENAIDGHAPYVHRNSVLALLSGLGPLGQKLTPILTREGKGLALIKETWPPIQKDYPGLGQFPKRFWRKYWQWVFRKSRSRGNFTGTPYTQEIVLPGITRITYPNYLYMRWGVPVDENSVRNFYWHVIRGSRAWKLLFCFSYYLYRRWAMNSNFSSQDLKIISSQDYNAREKVSWTDAVVIHWRKLVLQGYNVARTRRTRKAS